MSRARIGNSARISSMDRGREGAVVAVGSIAYLRGRAGLDLVLDPAVALLLELRDELGAALLDDAAVVEDVHGVRLDQVEDALVVGDDQDAHSGARELVDSLGDDA